MDYENLLGAARGALTGKTAAEFVRAARLIEALADQTYRAVGGHFRHNLDFANSFLNGLAGSVIDYNRRERDPRIETDRKYAIERTIFLIRRLAEVVVTDAEILVASEIEPGARHRSSVARELEFLHSHTVHHHALVAEKLSHAGVKIPTEFGVAPSTLEFWARRKAA